MAKVKTSVVFKHYAPQQSLLLPPSLEELIGPKHLVRVVNEVVEAMDISDLINLYQGGGTSSFHPRMLLKVLLYAYSVKIYTGRKIAKALGQDIHFMWLSGMSRPDFRTINNFRSSKAKEIIEVLFKEMLEFLVAQQYIKLENYFCDGTTLRADTNQHKMVWKKNAERYGKKNLEHCRELFKQIEELNDQENKAYGSGDLEEHGASSAVTKEAIAEKVTALNQTIRNAATKSCKRKAATLKKKLREAESKIDKYDVQIAKAGKRSGYNKTDPDASAMMMKNKVEVLPAYNILAGSEQQFITGISVHQTTNDGVCFEEHLQQIEQQQPSKPDRIIADSIFGTEQNYELLQSNEIANYMKFPLYHKEQTKAYQQNRFIKENFSYDPVTDSYGCPNDQRLIFKGKRQHTHKRTGYRSVVKLYECNDCSGCPFIQQCCKSTKGNNRQIEVNEKLETFKQQARENLHTELGQTLKKRRSIEIESCFGDIKHNMGFRRFHLRGLHKVKTEFALVAMAHNLRKLHLKELKKTA
ncbi:IS1182 family transposase [Paraflavitalea pollutisoli]|uniref:IS1182 family transposase n=1 Tax=Paraflavitalea pollutisoli TaxID=3034143 RepID=UPI0023EBDA98|nr:IS1182 family transposase [Paraflavitalea sp. H1-2-19X]